MFEQKRQEIAQLIERYFSASYHGKGDEMLGVFHPAAHIYGQDEQGMLIDWPVADFAKRVDSGTPPAALGQEREDEILSIHFTGEKTATALVRLRLRRTRYTDILSLIHIDGRWQVIAKLLSAEKVEEQ